MMVLANTPTGTPIPPPGNLPRQNRQSKPSVQFSWNITHTTNHWSNEDTNFEYTENVLVPYFQEQHDHQGLSDDQQPLVISDIFAGHKTEVRSLYADVSSNGDLKGYLKQLFSNWFVDEVTKQLKTGDSEEKPATFSHQASPR